MPPRKSKAGKRSKKHPEDDGVPLEFQEDVDKFHDERERGVLVDDEEHLSDLSGDNENVGVYDLDLSEEDSDDEDADTGDRLAQRKAPLVVLPRALFSPNMLLDF